MVQQMKEAVDSYVRLVKEGKLGADQGVEHVRLTEQTFANLWDSSEQSKKAAIRLLHTSGEAAKVTDGVRRERGRLVSQISGGQS